MRLLLHISMGCMKIVITLRKVPLKYAEGASSELSTVHNLIPILG